MNDDLRLISERIAELSSVVKSLVSSMPDKPFNRGPEWWTAYGVIAALGIATIPPIIRMLYKRVRRPRLSIEYATAQAHSGPNDDVFWLRLPIRNGCFCDTAKHVEVFLEEIQTISEGEVRVHHGAPMRMTWCHTGQAYYDQIPSKCFRLLSLGYFRFRPDATSIRYTFDGEVKGPYEEITHFNIPTDSCLKLSLCVTAKGVPAERHSLFLKRRVRLAQDFLYVEKA